MTNTPTRFDLLWPILEILKETGGSASIDEILVHLGTDRYLRKLGIKSETFNILHLNGPQTEIAYQAAWARTLLKYINAVENSSRGVWSITRIGREIPSESRLVQFVRDDLTERSKTWTKSKQSNHEKTNDDEELSTNETGEKWQQDLIQTVLDLDPFAFERLCQRLLREAGFVDVSVTSRTGDGGIDGTGILRINLLTFRVGFQCKRFTQNAVPSKAIREFMGALQGSADSGLFLTTSYFTQAAIEETQKSGKVRVDLIDGTRLCKLMKEYELGIRTKQVEQVEIESEFFQNI